MCLLKAVPILKMTELRFRSFFSRHSVAENKREDCEANKTHGVGSIFFAFLSELFKPGGVLLYMHSAPR